MTRIPRSGLFWGVAEIYESDVLTRLMPPGSELEPPAECTAGPARCNPRRTPRVVVREDALFAGDPIARIAATEIAAPSGLFWATLANDCADGRLELLAPVPGRSLDNPTLPGGVR